jgi:DNA invertase Pin-like site-specific DNA recombinase
LLPAGGKRHKLPVAQQMGPNAKLPRESGLKRAKAAGEVLGRPPTLTAVQRAVVQQQIAAGAHVSALAKRYGTSGQTIMRARDAVRW